jgi:hypothetical protein
MSTPTAIIAEDEATLRGQLVEQLGQLWPELAIVGEAHGVPPWRCACSTSTGPT